MSFEPVKITLSTPITHGGKTISELEFLRNICAGDLRDMKVGVPTYDDVREIASRICGVPAPILKNMDWDDFSEVVEVIMGFFNRSRLTGGRE